MMIRIDLITTSSFRYFHLLTAAHHVLRKTARFLADADAAPIRLGGQNRMFLPSGKHLMSKGLDPLVSHNIKKGVSLDLAERGMCWRTRERMVTSKAYR